MMWCSCVTFAKLIDQRFHPNSTQRCQSVLSSGSGFPIMVCCSSFCASRGNWPFIVVFVCACMRTLGVNVRHLCLCVCVYVCVCVRHMCAGSTAAGARWRCVLLCMCMFIRECACRCVRILYMWACVKLCMYEGICMCICMWVCGCVSIDYFFKMWWPWKPVQLDGYLD